MKKKILITGGAGFIGSNFIHFFIKKYPHFKIFNLDKLTYAGDLKNLDGISENGNYHFLKNDIAEKKEVDELFQKYQFSDVIHFAAESHVDNSISNPGAFIQTNIVGTFNLLNSAYKLWMNGPFKIKDEFKTSRFHHISTDEVYGSLGETGFFTEETPYAPNSPYSASKASSDHLVRSYFHTYGMNVVTTNCSNNYGPRQHFEKLIPTVIRKALKGEKIPIYGNGLNIRDWLYVDDHCEAIDLVFHQGQQGETYNIGSNNEQKNIDIAHRICLLLDKLKPKNVGKYSDQIEFVTDRPGHDFRYAIDAKKIKDELGFVAKTNFNQGLEQTIKYYLDKF
jgi:dTDP-glucose 4,6-dehydratase